MPFIENPFGVTFHGRPEDSWEFPGHFVALIQRRDLPLRFDIHTGIPHPLEVIGLCITGRNFGGLLEGLREIRRAVRLPLVGIGGLNRANAAEVIRNGADGVAVVSSIVAADNPEVAARELRQVINEARQT